MRAEKGFTSTELVMVMTMTGIMLAIASPFFMQWRSDMEARKGARAAYDALRRARSTALSTSIQQMVSFDPAGRRFRSVQGRRAYRTPADQWGSGEWVVLPSAVSLTSGADGSRAWVDVQFNGDGTARLQTPAGTDLIPPASAVSICLQGSSSRKDTIVVSNCGRITLQ